MKKRSKADSYIGMFATRANVTGVLVRRSDEHLEVLGRFVKHRIKTDEFEDDRFSTGGGLRTGDDSDFTIQMASGGGGSTFFAPTDTGGEEGGLSSVSQEPTPPFLMQAREIMSDARGSGLADSALSFCVASPDVSYFELALPVEEVDSDKSKGVSSATRKKLLKQLPEFSTESFEAERVGFLPMLKDGNQARFIAVVPVIREPVVPTIRMMALQLKSHMPSIYGIRSDISVLSALIAKSAVAAKGQRTAVVRVGTDDTMILLFDGPNLQYFERLRSITTYDSPEKVCSRIMLQQDESRIGELDNVLVLSDGRLDPLVESFQSFYPEAVVEPMIRVLEEHGVRIPEKEASGLRAGAILAVGSVMIDAFEWERDDEPAASVNLLPKKLLSKETGPLAFAWHTAAVLAVLFIVTFMSVTSYLDNESQIDNRRSELMRATPSIPIGDPDQLQQKVDSLTAVHAELTQSLHMLDSLLVGSDRWSRFLENLTEATGDDSGLWLGSVDAASGRVKIMGSARSRSRIADFTREMEGSIEQISSQEVTTDGGQVTIYNFTMSTTVTEEMPEVALYLREHTVSEEDLSGLTRQQRLPANFEVLPMTQAASRRQAQNEGGQ